MQTQRNDQRPQTSNPDGRRDTEQSSAQGEGRVVHPDVSDMDNRTVCLSATLAGKGDMK